MYRKIIVGYDGSNQAKDALALAKLLADVSDAELHLGAVFPLRLPLRGGFSPVLSEAERELEHGLAEAATAVGAMAQPVQSGSPARGLYELTEEIGADLLVVGSSKRGRLGQTLLGNVAVTLMHGSPCAVAVAPLGYAEHPDPRLSAIVVGYDGSPESQLALEEGCKLARASGAPLKLVSAAEPPTVSLAATTGGASYGWETLQDAIIEQARHMLEQGRASVPHDIPVETTFISGAAANALANAASAPGSILLLGSRAYGPLRRVLLGSVSRELASSAPCPLIVHPRGLSESPSTTTTAAAELATG